MPIAHPSKQTKAHIPPWRDLLGLLKQLGPQGIDLCLQLQAAGADPLRKRGAGDGETSSTKDGFLTVQRQVIGVLVHQHLSQQPGGGDGRTLTEQEVNSSRHTQVTKESALIYSFSGSASFVA